MKNTCVNYKNFQFITDFRNSSDSNPDFRSLTIPERVILSSFLTALINEKVSKNSIYTNIFNFTGEKNEKHVKHYSFSKMVFDTITKMMKKKQEFFSYLKEHAMEITESKTDKFRTQLNPSEMNILNEMKFRRNPESFMTALYILGVAKAKTTLGLLNRIPADSFCPSNITISINNIRKFFEKIGFEENKNFKFNGKFCYFGNGFNIPLEEKYYSEEQKVLEMESEISEFLKELTVNVSNVSTKDESEKMLEAELDEIKF